MIWHPKRGGGWGENWQQSKHQSSTWRSMEYSLTVKCQTSNWLSERATKSGHYWHSYHCGKRGASRLEYRLPHGHDRLRPLPLRYWIPIKWRWTGSDIEKKWGRRGKAGPSSWRRSRSVIDQCNDKREKDWNHNSKGNAKALKSEKERRWKLPNEVYD